MRLGFLAVAIAVVLVEGCTGAQTFIDGYPVGELARCANGCVREIGFAREWLDREHPGHAPVDHVEIHLTDYRSAAGSRIVMVRTGGGTYVAVFVLVDGSREAVEVGCGVGVDPTMCFTQPPGSFDL